MEVIITTNTLSKVPFQGSTESIDSRSSILARNAARLLGGVSSDFFYEVVLSNAELNTNGVTRQLTSFSFTFYIYNNSTVKRLDGSTFIAAGWVNRNPSDAELVEASG